MPISLDHHATTPTAPEVVAAMAPYWSGAPWNAHSPHAGGAVAERAVARARAAIADLIGASPAEIVFTSGATEANNIAILGTAAAARASHGKRRRILSSAIEHKSVLEAARHVALDGFSHELIPVTPNGIVDLAVFDRMISGDVLLVSVMAANNEVGTLQPLEQISARCSAHGVVFHVDGAQIAGRLPFDVVEAGCDLASLSAHKMYGPNGVGALFVSAASPIRPTPLMFGGGQEGGLRPGTLPVPLIVGFGRAAQSAIEQVGARGDEAHLATVFTTELQRRGVVAVLNGDPGERLPGSLNFRIPGVDADDIVHRLGDRLHLSTGSACQSGELTGSYVLRAMGLSDEDVSASFRACFGRDHTEIDAQTAAKILAEVVLACENGAGRRVQQQGEVGGKVRVG